MASEPHQAPVFRAQALERSIASPDGTVLLARPVSYLLLTFLFCSIGSGVIAFLCLFGVTRTTQVPGVVLPAGGLLKLQSNFAGIVTERRVQEGQHVRAGEVLFLLTNERPSVSGSEAGRDITALMQLRRASLVEDQAQSALQTRQHIQAVQRRVRDLEGESQRLREQISLQTRRVDLAEAALARFTTLKSERFISDAGLDEKRAAVIDQHQRLSDLRRSLAASERDGSTAAADLASMEIQLKRDSEAAARAIAEIDQELTDNQARREMVIRAPQTGILTAIAVNPGQAVNAGQTIATLLPELSHLEAELYAPSRSAGFIKPGMDVQLRFDAYPYEKFGQQHGRIIEVSKTAVTPAELPFPAVLASRQSFGEPLYRIRVALDQQSVRAFGEEHVLRAGMSMDASVQLERRQLYEWVLRPLHSFSQRI